MRATQPRTSMRRLSCAESYGEAGLTGWCLVVERAQPLMSPATFSTSSAISTGFVLLATSLDERGLGFSLHFSAEKNSPFGWTEI